MLFQKERVSRMSDDISSASTSKKRRKERDSDAGSEPVQSDTAGDSNAMCNFDLVDLDDF